MILELQWLEDMGVKLATALLALRFKLTKEDFPAYFLINEAQINPLPLFPNVVPMIDG